ncbi:hypothetical protein HaLaN_15976, partial [Haematococcus lacustris]
MSPWPRVQLGVAFLFLALCPTPLALAAESGANGAAPNRRMLQQAQNCPMSTTDGGATAGAVLY